MSENIFNFSDLSTIASSKVNNVKTPLHLTQIDEYLLIACEALRKQELRQDVSIDTFQCIEQLLQSSNVELTTKLHCYKLLRNSCAGNSSNQDLISRTHLFEVSKSLCVDLSDSSTEQLTSQELSCLSCMMQFLGNAVTGHSHNQALVWNLFADIFGKLLKTVKDEKFSTYSTMVIYNCLKNTENTKQLLDDKNVTPENRPIEILVTLLSILEEHDNEWCMYLLEQFLQEEGEFLKAVYSELNDAQSYLVVQTTLSRLQEYEKSRDRKQPYVNEKNLLYLSEVFIHDAYRILGLEKHSPDSKDTKPELVRYTLDCLCLCTSFPDVYTTLKGNSLLLKAVIDLLSCMKSLSEQPNSVFKEVNKIHDKHDVDDTHPALHSLKCQLIRLVANLCYQNKANQDLVRELDGIHLILDHTNIDVKNPFVTQWAVLAIRNLCDNNNDNKAVIASMKLEGLTDKVDELRKYGVAAEIQGDKVVVKKVTGAQ